MLIPTLPSPSLTPEILPSVTPVLGEAANQAQQGWQLDWNTVLASIIAGAVAGVFIVIMQVIADYCLHKFEKWRENKSSKVVTFPHQKRFIDGEIFNELSPGRSVEYMKTALGAPAMTLPENVPIFHTEIFLDEKYEEKKFRSAKAKEKYSDEYHTTTSYVYHFENAIVKITSKDKEVIDSLAVELSGSKGSLKVPQLPLGWGEEDNDLILGQSKVTKHLIEECQSFSYEFNRFENMFVCCLYTASPLYTYYSYFGVPDGDMDPDPDKPETFIGGTIYGVCLHTDKERCYVIRHWDYS